MSPTKRKGFSAKQSRRMSRKMESSQIGTHHARHAASSASRRAREYDRGAARASAAKRVGVAIVLIIALAALAFFVGSTVFFGTTSSRLSLGSSDVSSKLVAAQKDEPYYALFAADLDGADDGSAGFSADVIIVAHVDEGAGSLALLSVPSNTQASLSDGEAHPLSEALAVGGDAELLAAVSSGLDVDLAHYARLDAAGSVSLADALGGVSLTLSEEVDDPRAGIHYSPAGE